MPSTLTQVLHAFDTDKPLTTLQLARRLQVEPSMLEGMLDYWVRKGKLREVSQSEKGCTTCGAKTGCPFIMSMPKQYERVTDKTPVFSNPSCDLHTDVVSGQTTCAKCGTK